MCESVCVCVKISLVFVSRYVHSFFLFLLHVCFAKVHVGNDMQIVELDMMDIR